MQPDKDKSSGEPDQPAPPDVGRTTPDSGRNDEDTQTLSLEELGITPPPRELPVASAAPMAPAEAVQQPMPPSAPPAPEATARLEPLRSEATTGPAESVLVPESDDEPELPYSLQPDNLNETTPQVSRASRVRKRVSAKTWLLVGIGLGLAVGAWVYFYPWHMKLPPARPQRQEMAALPRVEGVAPPVQWTRIGALYFGKDEINKPWIYDPVTGQAAVALQSVPADLDWKRLVVVARPPLEPFTRLAWIQGGGAGGGALLVCRDFSFHEAAKAAGAMEASVAGLNWSVSLPAGDYPFAPAVADTPDPKVGVILVVAGGGELHAWNPQAPADGGPAWRVKLDSPVIAGPRAWLDLRSSQARLWLLAPMAQSLVIVDAASGQVADKLDWPEPLDPAFRLALVPMRLGDRGWGWLASNGRQAFQWLLGDNGRPTLVWNAKLPDGLAGKGEAPRLCTFPDPDAPGADQFALTAGDGRTVWLNQAQMTQARNSGAIATIEARATGDLAAVDLNGDGYWDLVGINADGNLWYRPGPANVPHAGESIPWGDQVSASLGSAVSWRLDPKALVDQYFSRDGRPQEASLALPTFTSSNIGLLRKDWDRRYSGGS
jgi:hypothetical protein